jgi:hypothetical protein
VVREQDRTMVTCHQTSFRVNDIQCVGDVQAASTGARTRSHDGDQPTMHPCGRFLLARVETLSLQP